MSYIRPNSPYKYIEGNSNGDYVFESSYRKGKKLFPYIEDYGSVNHPSLNHENGSRKGLELRSLRAIG